jgi:hypothetical protein
MNTASFNKVFANGYLVAYALALLLAYAPLYPNGYAGTLFLNNSAFYEWSDMQYELK